MLDILAGYELNSEVDVDREVDDLGVDQRDGDVPVGGNLPTHNLQNITV